MHIQTMIKERKFNEVSGIVVKKIRQTQNIIRFILYLSVKLYSIGDCILYVYIIQQVINSFPYYFYDTKQYNFVNKIQLFI